MNLVSTKTLTESQTAQVRELEALCRAEEPFALQLFLSSELNRDPGMNAFFLLCEEDLLVGYLTLFAPDPGLAETTALVRPTHRRRGYFTRLLAAAKAEAAAHGVTALLLCHEPVCESGGAVLKKLPLTLDRTEYQLELDKSTLPAVPDSPLTLVPADRSMAAELSRISAAAFGEEYNEESRARTERFLDSATVSGWAAMLDGRIVGQVSLNTEGGEGYLCGLCIDPALQGRGLGRAMLAMAVHEAAKLGLPVRLDVDSTNAGAYALYRSSGFREKARCDYWRLNILA